MQIEKKKVITDCKCIVIVMIRLYFLHHTVVPQYAEHCLLYNVTQLVYTTLHFESGQI